MLVALFILIVGIVVFFVLQSFKKPPKDKSVLNAAPSVQVKTVKIEPLTIFVESYGEVTPKYETEIVAQVSGQVVELSPKFLRGGFVAQGELLARIDPNDYEAALIDAQAKMASARAALEQERAQGKVAEREWKRITDTSPTELSLRKPQLAQEIARVKSAQAAILVAQRNLERTEIKSPYDAIIENRNLGLGSYVRIGSVVGKLLGTETAEIRLPLANEQFKFLNAEGLNADVILHVEGETKTWNAHIARSERVVDAKNRMTYLVAEVKDPYQLSSEAHHQQIPIKFGTYVNASISGKKLPQATKVPRYLINNNAIATLAKNNTLHYKKVTILRQNKGEAIITKGLLAGDNIVISALDYPFEGMPLSPITSSQSDSISASMVSEVKLSEKQP